MLLSEKRQRSIESYFKRMILKPNEMFLLAQGGWPAVKPVGVFTSGETLKEFLYGDRFHHWTDESTHISIVKVDR